jgi:hypothetical protein
LASTKRFIEIPDPKPGNADGTWWTTGWKACATDDWCVIRTLRESRTPPVHRLKTCATMVRAAASPSLREAGFLFEKI